VRTEVCRASVLTGDFIQSPRTDVVDLTSINSLALQSTNRKLNRT
jgi:hypothetical protein